MKKLVLTTLFVLFIAVAAASTTTYDYSGTYAGTNMFVFTCNTTTDNIAPDNSLPSTCTGTISDRAANYADLATDNGGYLCSGTSCTIPAAAEYVYLVYRATIAETEADVSKIEWTWQGVKRSGDDKVYIYHWNYDDTEWVACGSQDTYDDVDIECDSTSPSEFINGDKQLRMLSKGARSGSSGHKTDYVELVVTYEEAAAEEEEEEEDTTPQENQADMADTLPPPPMFENNGNNSNAITLLILVGVILWLFEEK